MITLTLTFYISGYKYDSLSVTLAVIFVILCIDYNR